MKQLQHGLLGLRFVVFLFLLLSVVLVSGCSDHSLRFPTEYQAVFLDNNQVFIGVLEKVGSDFVSLHDVFYVQRVETEKKEVRNILVKRGSEWHAPDFMRINIKHLVYIEPVAPDSRVAQLIREAKAPPAPAPPPAEAPPAPAAPPAAAPKPQPRG